MTKDLDAFWMPFTANRQFKKAPRLLARSQGMYYWDDKGRQILDGVAGLWCVNAGHARPRIVQAIQAQAAELDYAPPFQMGHPKAFELAERVAGAFKVIARMEEQLPKEVVRRRTTTEEKIHHTGPPHDGLDVHPLLCFL